ncbi:MAG: HEAT repeat domain-containing protein [Candidatus Micrarchaeota archaeon]
MTSLNFSLRGKDEFTRQDSLVEKREAISRAKKIAYYLKRLSSNDYSTSSHSFSKLNELKPHEAIDELADIAARDANSHSGVFAISILIHLETPDAFCKLLEFLSLSSFSGRGCLRQAFGLRLQNGVPQEAKDAMDATNIKIPPKSRPKNWNSYPTKFAKAEHCISKFNLTKASLPKMLPKLLELISRNETTVRELALELIWTLDFPTFLDELSSAENPSARLAIAYYLGKYATREQEDKFGVTRVLLRALAAERNDKAIAAINRAINSISTRQILPGIWIAGVRVWE